MTEKKNYMTRLDGDLIQLLAERANAEGRSVHELINEELRSVASLPSPPVSGEAELWRYSWSKDYDGWFVENGAPGVGYTLATEDDAMDLVWRLNGAVRLSSAIGERN